jgi:uncharacterized phiE125 gp8 family phage protein
MWYVSAVTSGPASEPVSLATLKTHLRVESDDENTLLNTYITAARSYVESYCGVPLVTRSITAKCDCFADFASVPMVPLGVVSGITYVDEAGAGQTLSTAVYEVRSDGLDASIVLKYGQQWPSIQAGSRITVATAVGYATVPEAIVAALLLLIAHWYENRETAGETLAEAPHSVTSLLVNHRNHRG